MSLKQRIQDDLKTAMLAGDRFTTDVLRGLKSAILYEELALNKRDVGLADAEVEVVFAREIKKRLESAELYDKGGNAESAKKERGEADIIRRYLPTPLDETEVKKIIDDIIASTGAEGMQAMGQVIGAAKKEVGTRADGAVIAKLVKEALQK